MTNPGEHRPYWAGQISSRILWNTKFNYSFHKTSSALTTMNPVYTLIFYLWKIHFNIITRYAPSL
jgi:hypothetical protein